MKSYLSLIPIYARVHRKQSRMTRLCIVLAVFLVTCIFGMADMEIRSQRAQIERSDGAWHVAFRELSGEQTQLIQARPEVAVYSRYGVLNYTLADGFTIGGEETAICGFDRGFLELMPAAQLTQGEFPAEGEAVLTENTAARLGVKPGDSVELRLPDGSGRSLTVSALAKDTSMLAEQDGQGAFLCMETFMDICTQLDAPSYEGSLYVKFDTARAVEKRVSEICSALAIPVENTQENIKLLSVVGQSTDSYMLQLYGTAAVLAALVITAGTLMISSSLNADIARRTEFFGLMRCLGAEPKQVRRYVRREALNWCGRAIPLGVGIAVAVTWLLCWVLRLLSPGYFAQMPAFGVSPAAMALGAGLGLVTVLLAAASPAKRAARVSPMEALREKGGEVQPRRAAGTGLLHVEYALGLRHAVLNRRNFALMTGSFALSIILFLAFSTAIDFMHHAIRPLKPYSPDLSIISEDNTCSVSPALMETLQGDPAVKRVYGRMFAYNVPVETAAGELRVNLVSYEQHQYKWAEASLLEGTADGGVLTVYDAANPIALGDTLTGDFGSGTARLTVTGLLSDSPFTREAGVETVICSQELFTQLTGETAYTIIDIQLSGKATEEDVKAIRALAGDGTRFSDRRLSNQEVRGAFYSMSVFMYGFLMIIALIAAFNIINSMSLSVAARTRQYGAMRAIGMGDGQLYRMTMAEALSYAVFGVLLGCGIGLPINKQLFSMLVTSHWGDSWSVPLGAMFIIIFVVLFATVVSVGGPVRRIRDMTIVETIHAD